MNVRSDASWGVIVACAWGAGPTGYFHHREVTHGGLIEYLYGFVSRNSRARNRCVDEIKDFFPPSWAGGPGIRLSVIGGPCAVRGELPRGDGISFNTSCSGYVSIHVPIDAMSETALAAKWDSWFPNASHQELSQDALPLGLNLLLMCAPGFNVEVMHERSKSARWGKRSAASVLEVPAQGDEFLNAESVDLPLLVMK